LLIGADATIFARKFVVDMQTAVSVVNEVITLAITQGQFDATVDFCFKVEQENFRNSNLLRKLNAGDFDGAAAQFLCGTWHVV
jgi:lysozyme